MNESIRRGIVEAALEEVSTRARELIDAGCDIGAVADGMRIAAEMVVSERIASAMLNLQSPESLDAYIDHSEDRSSASGAAADYRGARTLAEREDALARLIEMANRGAMRRREVKLGRVLTAFGIAYAAIQRSRSPRNRARRSPSSSSRDPADGDPDPAEQIGGLL